MKNIALSKTLLAATLSSLFLIGCGGSDSFGENTDNDSDDDNTTITTFDGTWKDACFYDFIDLQGTTETVVISGTDAAVSVNTYNTADCSGSAIRTEAYALGLTYQGEVTLSDCYNGQNVDVELLFPVIINNISYTETEFASLSLAKKGDINAETEYDLFCTNSAVTALYSGDYTTGDATTSASRPTSADLTDGLIKQ